MPTTHTHTGTVPTSTSDTAFPYRRTSTDIVFDVKTLLWLSDTVRAAMSDKDSNRSFGRASDSLLRFLERAMLEETIGPAELDFDTIKQAHLDKLVAEMIEFGKQETASSARALRYATHAVQLQRLWRTRYKAQYFTIDEIRTQDLVATGRLKDVRFVEPKKHGNASIA